MRELRFHRDIYRGEAVDEAAKVYRKYGEIDLEEQASHWVVKIQAASPARERRIADELANYALGLTIRDRRRTA